MTPAFQLTGHGQDLSRKSTALLKFLKGFQQLRAEPQPIYGTGEQLWWVHQLGDLPRGAVSFPLLEGKSEEFWLDLEPPTAVSLPQIPEPLQAYLGEAELIDLFNNNPEFDVLSDDPQARVGLIQDVVEKLGKPYQGAQQVREQLQDFLLKQWLPAFKKRRFLAQVYRDLQAVSRQLRDDPERYDFVLAVGYLRWDKPKGPRFARHLLTVPAKVELESRGKLQLTWRELPSDFRLEYDLVSLLQTGNRQDLDQAMEELGEVDPADAGAVCNALRTAILPLLLPDAVVAEELEPPAGRASSVPLVAFAPAFVFRQRRMTGYLSCIERLERQLESTRWLQVTGPWVELIREGQEGFDGDRHVIEPPAVEVERPLFPLPTNREQEQIVERLRDHSIVVVKGPPGTGKSHTIANLITHLLAHGHKILVTAHTARALAVLRDKLPKDIRDLCVRDLGLDEQKVSELESSIRVILARDAARPAEEEWQRRMEELEERLQKCEGQRNALQRKLAELREREVAQHFELGSRKYSPGELARWVRTNELQWSWFRDDVPYTEPCPLGPEEIEQLACMLEAIQPTAWSHLRYDLPDFEIPPAKTVAEWDALAASPSGGDSQTSGARKAAQQELLKSPIKDLNQISEQLEGARTNLEKARYELASELIDRILEAALTDDLQGIELELQEIEKLVKEVGQLSAGVSRVRVHLPENLSIEEACWLVERRLAGLSKQRRCWWYKLFPPAELQETAEVEKHFRWLGRPPVGQEALEQLLEALRWLEAIDQLESRLRGTSRLDREWRARAAWQAQNRLKLAQELLRSFRNISSWDGLRRCLQEALAEARKNQGWEPVEELLEWLRKQCQGILARRSIQGLRFQLDLLSRQPHPHPQVSVLVEALREKDWEKWEQARAELIKLLAERPRWQQAQALLGRLERTAPTLVEDIRSASDARQWASKVRQLAEAWQWARARNWLALHVQEDALDACKWQLEQLEREILDLNCQLASEMAWNHFFRRVSDKTLQALKGWKRAMDRLGKGRGKHAWKHRQQAQRYMRECIDEMPAWIMPLHRLWETVQAEPGLFDTVIIDEASQAGTESLLLLLLAKRIIIVGDDQQNSPEGVGIAEDRIEELAGRYLSGFFFGREFRPDTSLYDHGDRIVRNPVVLREHFRCVPEIIEFSNRLCYSDAPLIPLRQPTPGRLEPLRCTFVEGAEAIGDSSRLTNLQEAQRVAKLIVDCIERPEYNGKTFGVISLQGEAQARLIERLLLERISASEWDSRRLRCAAPSGFQGDERDVIFLSMVVAPNYNYRALTSLDDKRRFNVAVSRARDQVWLVHSVNLKDLSPDDLRHQLLKYVSEGWHERQQASVSEELKRLKEALRMSRRPGSQPQPYESWFEVDVAVKLLERGYQVVPQYRVGSYRIDLVLEGSGSRIGVECYGEHWHGPDRAAEDFHRLRVLHRAGWNILVVSESEFYLNPERVIQSIEARCRELGIHPSIPRLVPEGEFAEGGSVPTWPGQVWQASEGWQSQ